MLRFGQDGLRLFPLGNVVGNANGVAPAVQLHHGQRQFQGQQLPVLAAAADFQIPAGREGPANQGGFAGGTGGTVTFELEQLVHVPPNGFRAGPAKNLFGQLVPEGYAALVIHRKNRAVGGVRHGAEFLLALHQLPGAFGHPLFQLGIQLRQPGIGLANGQLRMFAIRDVPEYPDQHPFAAHGHPLGADFHGKGTAVFPAMDGFKQPAGFRPVQGAVGREVEGFRPQILFAEGQQFRPGVAVSLQGGRVGIQNAPVFPADAQDDVAAAAGHQFREAQGFLKFPGVGDIPADNHQTFPPAVLVKQRHFEHFKFMPAALGIHNALLHEDRLARRPGFFIAYHAGFMHRLQVGNVPGHFLIRPALPGPQVRPKQLLGGRVGHLPAARAVLEKNGIGNGLHQGLEILPGPGKGGRLLQSVPGPGDIVGKFGQQLDFIRIKGADLPVRPDREHPQ